MKYHSIFRYLYIFYAFVFLLHVINVFIESTVLNYVIGVFSIVMFGVSFMGASRLFKYLASAFVVIGGVAFIGSDQSLLTIPAMVTSNLSLLTLLAMLPWMNSVVRSGRFDRSLNNLLKVNVSDLGKLYPRSSVTTLTFASFLNLSAATISQDILSKNLSSLPTKMRNSFISTATLRGYSLALLWSPLEILLAVSIFTTGVDYVSLLPWLLLIAGLTFMMDAIWGRFHYRKYSYENVNRQSNADVKTLTKKIVLLLIALILFLTFVIALGNLFNLDFIFTVTLLIFPFALSWAFIMKRVRSFWVIGWNTWKTKTNAMQNFIILFLSLAFFEASINGTTYLDFIKQPLLALSDYPLILFIFIQVIFIFLSMFGIHPIATIGILTGVITSLLAFMNPVSLAIVLVTSAVATTSVSTYGLVVQITAMNLGDNPYRITLKNLPYALCFGGIGSFVAYLLL
ncbi:hypothetical protein JOC34_004248 [Virgibacillus halotolerans]|uniref:hypothetical protein n=1 Tax=Virgibacillus halotolerans TaxID=1071053 RepID=UPI00195FB100|nr:hypothetical protein [Virgibacillus halotolerans]MBM7601819.1 hypothetical protein [Virgibacillus halotolerans]